MYRSRPLSVLQWEGRSQVHEVRSPNTEDTTWLKPTLLLQFLCFCCYLVIRSVESDRERSSSITNSSKKLHHELLLAKVYFINGSIGFIDDGSRIASPTEQMEGLCCNSFSRFPCKKSICFSFLKDFYHFPTVTLRSPPHTYTQVPKSTDQYKSTVQIIHLLKHKEHPSRVSFSQEKILKEH